MTEDRGNTTDWMPEFAMIFEHPQHGGLVTYSVPSLRLDESEYSRQLASAWIEEQSE